MIHRSSMKACALPVLLLSFASCAAVESPLEAEPWSEFQEGKTVIGATTGWALFEAKARAVGKSGVLEGESGTDTSTLRPQYGGAVKMHHMITDHFGLGGIVELRSFNPEVLKPLSATLRAEDFETWHLVLSSRYYFSSFEDAVRWRPYVGLDLTYVPEVDLGQVNVDYPDGSGIPDEQVAAKGSEYWGLGGVVGFNYLVSDELILEFGAFYEYALTTSEDTVAFQNLGGAEAQLALRAQGVIAFLGLSYSF